MPLSPESFQQFAALCCLRLLFSKCLVVLPTLSRLIFTEKSFSFGFSTILQAAGTDNASALQISTLAGRAACYDAPKCLLPIARRQVLFLVLLSERLFVHYSDIRRSQSRRSPEQSTEQGGHRDLQLPADN